MNSTLSRITLCKPYNNRAQKQPILLGLELKSPPKQVAHVQTETGASAAQHPLQHNQIAHSSDDLALVATSSEGLQAQLDLLHTYAAIWKLTVNIDKTKAVVFQQSSTNQVHPIYNGASIDVVESFKYLEVELHRTKSFASAAPPCFETGERSQFALFSRCAELGINNPVLRMQLWDSLVQPTIMYGVEFWGVRDISKGVLADDELHWDFLRRLLGVH